MMPYPPLPSGRGDFPGQALDSGPVAYFCMEIAIDPAVPTYSGGLGVLAGDTLRTAADLGFPMVAVSLLYRHGYYQQHLDEEGRQSEQAATWSPEAYLDPVDARCSVTIEHRPVHLRAWRYRFRSPTGFEVPVYFLDTTVEENSAWDRELSGWLYGGDARYRLCQEVVLAVGGLTMLRALGYGRLSTYHMNEGHAAFLPLALLDEELGGGDLLAASETERALIQSRCVFTTHTPIAPGHDQFNVGLVWEVLGGNGPIYDTAVAHAQAETLNMTHLALAWSRYVNAVSRQHQETTQSLFPGHPIHAITNGVHAVAWTCPSFATLYDRYVPQWRLDNLFLRHAASIPLGEILGAHAAAKRELLAEVERRLGARLDPNVLTIGFARRAATYKRADLLVSDLERLKRVVDRVGPLQVIYAGKAHPRDDPAKALIQRVFAARRALGDVVRVAYLENYDVALGRLVCAGVDLWLNTPQRPMEASGTSGMKAALNGVPSLSVLDGWWIEGHVEGVTGWSIGHGGDHEPPEEERASLYDKLEYLIAPLFYRQPLAFAEVMRGAMAINGSYFNTQRMLLQYIRGAYAPDGSPPQGLPGKPHGDQT